MNYKLVSAGQDILLKSNNISWGTDSQTLGSTLTFDSLHSLSMGQIVSFYIDNFEVFRGAIITCGEEKFTYTYNCFDYTFYLKSEVVKQFNNVDVTSGLSSLLLEFDIKHSIINIPTRIDKYYKGETIASIIDDFLEIASKEQCKNYYKEIQAERLVIECLDNQCIYPKILYDEQINVDWSIENLKNKIQVISNGEDTTPIIAESVDPTSQWKYGQLQHVEKVDEKDISQAKNIADNLLLSLNRIEHSTTIKVVVLDRGETIRANRLMYFNNSKLKAGWYKIKSANHTVANGVHEVSISLEW